MVLKSYINTLDKDECADNTSGCPEGCRNLNGTFECLCSNGFKFDALTQKCLCKC